MPCVRRSTQLDSSPASRRQRHRPARSRHPCCSPIPSGCAQPRQARGGAQPVLDLDIDSLERARAQPSPCMRSASRRPPRRLRSNARLQAARAVRRAPRAAGAPGSGCPAPRRSGAGYGSISCSPPRSLTRAPSRCGHGSSPCTRRWRPCGAWSAVATELDALAGGRSTGGRIGQLARSLERSATAGLIAFGVIAAALPGDPAGDRPCAAPPRSERLRARDRAASRSPLRPARCSHRYHARRQAGLARGHDRTLPAPTRSERDRLAETHSRPAAGARESGAGAYRCPAARGQPPRSRRETADNHALPPRAAEQASRTPDRPSGRHRSTTELRTPLAGILGLLRLVEPGSTQRAHAVPGADARRGRCCCSSCSRTCSTLLPASQGQRRAARQHGLQPARHSERRVFAVQGTRPWSRRLALVAEVDPRAADAVRGDRRKLSQILLNLVSNASSSTTGAVTVPHYAPGQPAAFTRRRGPRHRHRPPRQRRGLPSPSCRCDSGCHHAGTGLGLACAAAWSRPWAARSS